MKIILLGFPKSGTSSFQKLFCMLGYKSIHWNIDTKYMGTKYMGTKYMGTQYIGAIIEKNKKNKLPLLASLEQYDCITQLDVCISPELCYWAQLVDYKQLYEENKDCIFILNKRDPADIVNSFSRWNKFDERMYKYNPELFINNITLLELINKHYTDVEEFFAEKTGAKFLSYHIKNDSIEKLKKYIDIKNITKFPKENVNIKL
jgi:hypothetical protein